jgi:hypothetical protein
VSRRGEREYKKWEGRIGEEWGGRIGVERAQISTGTTEKREEREEEERKKEKRRNSGILLKVAD